MIKWIIIHLFIWNIQDFTKNVLKFFNYYHNVIYKPTYTMILHYFFWANKKILKIWCFQGNCDLLLWHGHSERHLRYFGTCIKRHIRGLWSICNQENSEHWSNVAILRPRRCKKHSWTLWVIYWWHIDRFTKVGFTS